MRTFLVILLLVIVSVGVFVYLNQQDASELVIHGVAWTQQGEYGKAIADFTEAIRIEPQYAEAFYNRGIALREKGELDQAIADYTEAIRLDSQHDTYFYFRARILSDCPEPRFRNGVQAVKDATRACELTQWKDSEFLTTLSAAYAEANDFPEAIRWIKKAMSMDDFDKPFRAKMLADFETGHRHEPRMW